MEKHLPKGDILITRKRARQTETVCLALFVSSGSATKFLRKASVQQSGALSFSHSEDS